MIKEILIKSCEILNRNDIIQTLKSVNKTEEISNEQIQSEVYKLLSYYNFVASSIFQNYFELTFTDTLMSDEYNKIQYYNLSFEPLKILSIYDEKHNPLSARVFSGYILTNSANKTYKITYTYLPEDIKDIDCVSELPKIINKKIICYGVVSEYLASKNLFNESEFWKNKFMYEIFKLKTHKERKWKSTFSLWRNNL